MGVYDTYGGIQLKIGGGGMFEYEIGEEVEIADGVYVGYGGVVVIVGKRLVAVFPNIIDKWGGIIKPEELISGSNPVAQAIKEVGDV